MPEQTSQNGARRAAVVFLIVWSGLIAGCTAPAVSEDMTVMSLELANRYPYSVHLFVQGGRKSVAVQLPQVSDEDFEKALADSIDDTRIFAGIGERGTSDYLLEVFIFELSQWVFHTTVRLEVGWRLTSEATGAVVWQESIKTTGDAGDGTTSLEVAVRMNIEQGLLRISELNL